MVLEARKWISPATHGLARKGQKGWQEKGNCNSSQNYLGKELATFGELATIWEPWANDFRQRLANDDPANRPHSTTPLRANDSDNDSARAKLRSKRRQDLDSTTKLSTTHRQYLSIAPRSYAPRTAYSRLIINQLARSDASAT